MGARLRPPFHVTGHGVAGQGDDGNVAGFLRLNHQPVATRLGNQNIGVGRVALNLLTKPVDMCFQGVGLDGGAVAIRIDNVRSMA